MLLSEFIKKGVSTLESLYPTAESRSVIMILCEEILGTKNYTHIVEPGYEIASAKESVLMAALDRLAQGEPVQYVVGNTEFCGRRYKVTPDVLIPRPETELLCNEAVEIGSRIQRMRQAYGKNAYPVEVLDLCTGSGCIAWTMALSIPGAKTVAVDISDEALGVASKQNFAQELKAKNIAAPIFLKADVLDTEQEFNHGPFDLILSNPPYIKESEKSAMRRNVLDYEPSLALFVPDEDPLLYYRAIAAWSRRFLKEDGFGLAEINESLGRETLAIFKAEGFAVTEIIKDFFEKNRILLYRKQA